MCEISQIRIHFTTVKHLQPLEPLNCYNEINFEFFVNSGLYLSYGVIIVNKRLFLAYFC